MMYVKDFARQNALRKVHLNGYDCDATIIGYYAGSIIIEFDNPHYNRPHNGSYDATWFRYSKQCYYISPDQLEFVNDNKKPLPLPG